MRAVKLDRPLVLESEIRLQDGAGGWSATWQAIGTLWAEIRPGAGRMVGAMGGEAPALALRITVRGLPQGHALRPVAGQRFRDGGRLFRIGAVTERDGSGRFLICMAEEVLP